MTERPAASFFGYSEGVAIGIETGERNPGDVPTERIGRRAQVLDRRHASNRLERKPRLFDLRRLLSELGHERQSKHVGVTPGHRQSAAECWRFSRTVGTLRTGFEHHVERRLCGPTNRRESTFPDDLRQALFACLGAERSADLLTE